MKLLSSPHEIYFVPALLSVPWFLHRELYTGPCIHPKMLLHFYGLLGRDGREMEGINTLLSERTSVVGPGAFVDVIMAE